MQWQKMSEEDKAIEATGAYAALLFCPQLDAVCDSQPGFHVFINSVCVHGW